jgi:hypothetical protein
MDYGVEFDVAEVLEYDRTYNYIGPDNDNNNISELFALRVRLCSKYFNQKEVYAKPSNMNIKQIPMIGEFVLLYKTFNQESNAVVKRETWYYVTSIDVQSSMNENMLPGISEDLSQIDIDKIKPGNNFDRKSISPLQPYEGDLLIEGRWGNSIRFSSTIDLTGPQTHYNVAVPWKGTDIQGAPLIVLSNGRKNLPNKQFISEDIRTDDASLYLTSTQKIPNLLLGNTANRNPLSKYLPNESQFAKSQFIGVADRIVLKAKTDIVILDSPTAIILNTDGEIKLGNDSATESMVHGDVLLQILQKIINQLQSSVQIGDTLAPIGGYVNNASYAKDAQSLLTELLSSKYFIQKNTY